MLSTALFRVVSLVAALHVVVATLPNGDIERTAVVVTPEGVRAFVEHQAARADVRTLHQRLLPRARYGWRIEEEKRSILMAEPGRPTGVIRRAYVLSGIVDANPDPNVAPQPTVAFQFYAPSREAAEELRDRLKKALAK